MSTRLDWTLAQRLADQRKEEMKLAPHARMLAHFGSPPGEFARAKCGACLFFIDSGTEDASPSGKKRVVGHCEQFRRAFTTIDSSRITATPKWRLGSDACGEFVQGKGALE